MLFATNNVCCSTDLQKPRSTLKAGIPRVNAIENSQLKKQMEAKDNMLTNKDGEILRLLNQIASDMVKRSDVDEIVKGAVAEEHDRMVAFYEEKMKAMAAEYEAVIASLKKKDKGGKKGGR